MRLFEKSLKMQKKGRRETEKIRLLISGHLPPPIGGIATYYQALLNSSLTEKVDLLFVQTSSQNRNLSHSGRVTYSNLIAAAKDYGRFFRGYITFRPELCHIGTAFGLSFLKHSICVITARVFGSRVLLHPHCGLSALYSDRPALWRFWFRQIIRLTDGLIALSNEWSQVSQIVPGTRVYLLQNSIDLAPYQAIAQDRLAQPLKNSAVSILYLGYIGAAKGSFELLEAARQLNSEGIRTSFDLVGGELRPGEADKLQQQIEILNLSHVIRIHPPVCGFEKLTCFRNADIFVYPSFSEGMPIAVIEAMASGLPIVASNVGGLPDMVRDEENGILVDPGRSDKLASALCRIINNPNLFRLMQQNSARIARERFDIEEHVERLVEIYDKCV